MTEKIKNLNREKFNELLIKHLRTHTLFNLKHLDSCFEYWYTDNNTLIKLICVE